VRDHHHHITCLQLLVGVSVNSHPACSPWSRLTTRRYEYSLGTFLTVFNQTLNSSKKDVMLENRLANIVEALTFDIYSYTCLGLFEKHKLMFSFQMTIKILEGVRACVLMCVCMCVYAALRSTSSFQMTIKVLEGVCAHVQVCECVSAADRPCKVQLSSCCAQFANCVPLLLFTPTAASSQAIDLLKKLS